jgi:hypothetical protein
MQSLKVSRKITSIMRNHIYALFGIKSLYIVSIAGFNEFGEYSICTSLLWDVSGQKFGSLYKLAHYILD